MHLRDVGSLQMTCLLKFHTFSVKIGQNQKKISRMKILVNFLTKLELHSKNRSIEKNALKDCYIILKHTESLEKKDCARGPAPKESFVLFVQFPSNHKFSAEDEK